MKWVNRGSFAWDGSAPLKQANPNCAWLTFHAKFGASSVFVDEHEKDEKEDAGKARQAHRDRDLHQKETHACKIVGNTGCWIDVQNSQVATKL